MIQIQIVDLEGEDADHYTTFKFKQASVLEYSHKYGSIKFYSQAPSPITC